MLDSIRGGRNLKTGPALSKTAEKLGYRIRGRGYFGQQCF
jgi:hypothetical protein